MLRLTDTSNLIPRSILDMQSIGPHWYAVHVHFVAASSYVYSYSHPKVMSAAAATAVGSLLLLKWCHIIMVEADCHLNLLPASILDMYKVFEHIDMLSIGLRLRDIGLGNELDGDNDDGNKDDNKNNWCHVIVLNITKTGGCLPHASESNLYDSFDNLLHGPVPVLLGHSFTSPSFLYWVIVEYLGPMSYFASIWAATCLHNIPIPVDFSLSFA